MEEIIKAITKGVIIAIIFMFCFHMDISQYEWWVGIIGFNILVNI